MTQYAPPLTLDSREPTVRPGEDPVYAAAWWYAVTTELFDRAYGQYRLPNGTTVPVTADERSAMNRNAKAQLKVARDWLRSVGADVTHWAFMHALHEVERSHEWIVFLKQPHTKPEGIA